MFTFGEAEFHGSAGAINLAQPVVGMQQHPMAAGIGSSHRTVAFSRTAQPDSSGRLAPLSSMNRSSRWPQPQPAADTGYLAATVGCSRLVTPCSTARRSITIVNRMRSASVCLLVAATDPHWRRKDPLIRARRSRPCPFGDLRHEPDSRRCSRNERGVAVFDGDRHPAAVVLFERDHDRRQLDRRPTVVHTGLSSTGEPVAADFGNPFPGSIVSSRFGFRCIRCGTS